MQQLRDQIAANEKFNVIVAINGLMVRRNLLVMMPISNISTDHLDGDCRQRMDAPISCILHKMYFSTGREIGIFL